MHQYKDSNCTIVHGDMIHNKVDMGQEFTLNPGSARAELFSQPLTPATLSTTE